MKTTMRKRFATLGAVLGLLLLAGFWFGQGAVIYYTNTDPTTGQGVNGQIWSLLVRTDTPGIYAHTGNGPNDWVSLGGGGTVTGCAGGTSVNCSLVGSNVVPSLSLPSITQPTPGQQLTALSATGSPTWSQPLPDIADGYVQYEEYNNAGTSSTMWAYNASGTGASCATNQSAVAEASRPGIADCQTGSTSTGRNSYQSGSSAVMFSGGTWTYTDMIGIGTLSNSTDGYGIQDGFISASNSMTQTNGCYFEYDERNVAGHNASNVQKWIAVCAKGSARLAYILDGTTVCDASFTSVNQPVNTVTLSTDTNWTKLTVIVNATATEADFYVNNVLSCKITTTANIPSTSANLMGYGHEMLKSVGTTSLHAYHDYTSVQFAASAPRS